MASTWAYPWPWHRDSLARRRPSWPSSKLLRRVSVSIGRSSMRTCICHHCCKACSEHDVGWQAYSVKPVEALRRPLRKRQLKQMARVVADRAKKRTSNDTTCSMPPDIPVLCQAVPRRGMIAFQTSPARVLRRSFYQRPLRASAAADTDSGFLRAWHRAKPPSQVAHRRMLHRAPPRAKQFSGRLG
jgi:hypothetical protein